LLRLLFCLILLFPSCDFNKKAAPNPPIADNSVDDFALLDQYGKFHELYYYSDKKVVVLISQGVGCPITRKSIPYLRQLKQAFGPQGVVFLMINANPQDDRDSIKQEASDYGINIPILEDKSQVITESLQITRTAEAVVIDPADWKIVYRGAINSQLGYDAQTIGIQHEYLKDAINAVLENQPVAQSQTTVKGCLFNLAGSRRTDFPSYNEDVVPILANRCLQCHVKGGIAPWSMDNYEKVKGWAPMIREVLRTKRMPPWQADPYYGKFKADLSLSPEELRTLVHWVQQGALNNEGSDSLIDAPRVASDGWVLGRPDLIFKLKEKQNILPANGSDQFKFIEADKPAEDDLWVRGIYWRPSNLKIVHHGNLVVQTPSEQDSTKDWFRNSGMDLETGQMIDGYSPGTGPFILPEGTGFFIPKGATLFFRMHYIPTGKPEADQTQIGLYLYKATPAHVLSVFVISSRLLKIPPGAKEYKMSASHVFKDSVTVYALQPHMHYRGRSMSFTVQYPDGKSEILLSVPNYKFRWQHRYILKKPKILPAGSRVIIEGSYDNSAQNPDNPDPAQEVAYGPLSTNEMFVGILYYVKLENQT
jgi:peroxiredoxin